MSITETRVGISPELFDIFGCFTDIRKPQDGLVSVVLVLRDEIDKDPHHWERVDRRFHTAIVGSLEDARVAIEWYASNYPLALNSVRPGVPTARLQAYLKE